MKPIKVYILYITDNLKPILKYYQFHAILNLTYHPS